MASIWVDVEVVAISTQRNVGGTYGDAPQEMLVTCEHKVL